MKIALTLVPKESSIHHFACSGLIAEHEMLAINQLIGTMTLMEQKNGLPFEIFQCHLTEVELRIIFPLLRAFPFICPYSTLYAALYKGGVTEQTNEEAAEHLRTAQEEECWEQEIRSIRGGISRARLKLRPIGISIASVASKGYLLMPIDTI